MSCHNLTPSELDLDPFDSQLGNTSACLSGPGTYVVGNPRGAVPAGEALGNWTMAVGGGWPHGLETDTDCFDAVPPLISPNSDTHTAATEQDSDEVRTLRSSDLALTSPSMPNVYLGRKINRCSDSVDGEDLEVVEQYIFPAVLQKEENLLRNFGHEDLLTSLDPRLCGPPQETPEQLSMSSSSLDYGSFYEATQYLFPFAEQEERGISPQILSPHILHSVHGNRTTTLGGPLPSMEARECSSHPGHMQKEGLQLRKNQGSRRRPVGTDNTFKTIKDRLEYRRRKKLYKKGLLNTRPYVCDFSFAGCPQVFCSKNEWKRHVECQHMQTKGWVCDLEICIDRRAVFNRKDLFGQHLKRMHAPSRERVNDQEGTGESSAKRKRADEEFQKGIGTIQKRCLKVRRIPPEQSKCIFCDKEFVGKDSWEARMEHVGRHYEAASGVSKGKRGSNPARSVELPPAKTDEWLVKWALDEGLIREVTEQDEDRQEGTTQNGGSEEQVAEGSTHGQGTTGGEKMLKRYRLVDNLCDPLRNGPQSSPHGPDRGLVDDDENQDVGRSATKRRRLSTNSLHCTSAMGVGDDPNAMTEAIFAVLDGDDTQFGDVSWILGDSN